MKKIIAFSLLTFALLCQLSAKTVAFQTDNYSGTLSYNDIAKPGEAIFARMNLKISRNAKKKNSPEVQATIELFKEEKKIDSSKFYFLNSKQRRQNTPDMLAAIPLSLWSNGGGEHSIKVIFSTGIPEEAAREIILPFTLETVEWNQEVLELDERNSGIKQDMSPERLTQIEKLNGILSTINTQNIYSLKPFIMPVNTNRQTAYCGDRRTYSYTNGKSSTSLHYGNDYGIPEGTDIFACSDGKVVLADFRVSTGWSVVIEHLPGLYSLYYHLSSLNVKDGDMVRQGEKIGLSGATGLATGPHLHWEVRLNMAAVQPTFFMKNFAFQPE
ncbi:MAG: M23 family metallopeptidase [Treponema sp.]|nr:M23 family metallopeptidase [Treponema sp.]